MPPSGQHELIPSTNAASSLAKHNAAHPSAKNTQPPTASTIAAQANMLRVVVAPKNCCLKFMLLAELIALAANGDNHTRRIRIVAQLVAEVGDVHVHRARFGLLVVDVPDALQQFLA